ncbi:guanitoxin biosynthesis MBL fold metallo-hydrolase GntH [Vibrio maritimus]|uniref:guanitoxin biosynthesis MBL fold metallo-hydrolase GntH n=1 Tax=Vibrio maritimus TaxID=990268 RepID=UPI0037351DDF
MRKIHQLSVMTGAILMSSAVFAQNPFEHYQSENSASFSGYKHYNYEQNVSTDELMKQGGKIYSSPEEIHAILQGGLKTDIQTGEELWKEGLMFDGIEPMDHMVTAANWFPRTEQVQHNEMRVTFMGTSPMIRPGQANTSIYVELGNGDNFVFDLGEASIANYIGAGVALNELDKVFITHLHVDHFGSLPYLYQFGGWNGRWEKPLTIYGPSGRNPEDGTRHMVEGMLQMLSWHQDAFDVFPSGNDIEVVEYDFKDDGGVIYDVDGVKVSHWRRSHAKDGASAYRLDWTINEEESLCFVWTGDGRPTELDIEYGKGCDLFVTEVQTELVGLASIVQGVPAFLTRYTIDTHHTSGYAAGWLANQVQPRLFMTTHMEFDPYYNNETVAQVREHWKGPYHFGAPDMIVANITPQKAWVREGIIPDFPNNRAPQFNLNDGEVFRVPVPKNSRADIQEQEIRDLEIDEALYYPEGYHPELLKEWPLDRDLIVPTEVLPESMKRGMGEKQRMVDEMREAHGLEPRSVHIKESADPYRDTRKDNTKQQ